MIKKLVILSCVFLINSNDLYAVNGPTVGLENIFRRRYTERAKALATPKPTKFSCCDRVVESVTKIVLAAGCVAIGFAVGELLLKKKQE